MGKTKEDKGKVRGYPPYSLTIREVWSRLGFPVTPDDITTILREHGEPGEQERVEAVIGGKIVAIQMKKGRNWWIRKNGLELIRRLLQRKTSFTSRTYGR